MTPVEPYAVTDVEPLHPPAQIGLSRFGNQVVVIIHQHVSMNPEPVALHQLGDQFAEMLPISLVSINRPSLVAAGPEVIPCVALLDPQWPGHGFLHFLPGGYLGQVIAILSLAD